MSHDESLHTYFSWLLYRGQGYQHSPMMHGPFQFHALSIVYLIFGVSDFTSRIPAALFSIACIWMMWYWRRYLGKVGALVAGFLLVISPYMLYYGRYVRNESFAAFSGIVMLYVILRHLETGEKKYLYMFAGSMVLHFVSKETAFIYSAQALLFLAIYFIARVTRQPWPGKEKEYRSFIFSLGLAVLLAAASVGYALVTRQQQIVTGVETAAPADPSHPITPLAPPEISAFSIPSILMLVGLLAAITSIFLLIQGYSWQRIREHRSFNLLMIAGMLVTPLLAPFLIKGAETWLHVSIPTTAAEVQAMSADQNALFTIGAALIFMFGISVLIGITWNKHLWWKVALVFWVPFTILYTTVFTNSDGFFTGTLGSLGYWLVQQGVQRGSQPWYYYILVQLPIYEFLPALGFILALAMGLGRSKSPSQEIEADPDDAGAQFPVTFGLLTWWSITSILAYSYAGERMPWLTVHMTWPLILMTGWAVGKLIEEINWSGFINKRMWLALILGFLLITGMIGALSSLLGPNPPFQGKQLAQLQATSSFLLPFILSVITLAAIFYAWRNWSFQDIGRLTLLSVFFLLVILTMRASFRAAYITYDQATEFLVYAHGARGVKEVIKQAEDISKRTTGGMSAVIAYDASAPDTGVSWPFVWYLRDFTNQRSFDEPTRSLRDSVVVIVDQKNFDRIDAALGSGFYRMDYIRMWWPMQDYFNLVGDRDPAVEFSEDYPCRGIFGIFRLVKSKDYSRICNSLLSPKIRDGIFQIWLNRDYTEYAQAIGRSDLALTTWVPSDQMRLYVRKDVASQIWNYGISPVPTEEEVDPTEGKSIILPADRILSDDTLSVSLGLNAPRSLAFAKDGTLYVTDSRNHRVVHLDPDGHILHSWGSFADGVSIPVGQGTFNEPWGIAVDPDGNVFVTDTWNHRVQKFTADGKYILAWGTFGQGETPESFYGPRGLAIDSNGRVFVADTGNKRIVVFDSDGNYITQFGAAGLGVGEFDEPVGVAVSKDGRVFVTDTWNQRIQSFQLAEDGINYTPSSQWDVYGWFGQSLDNKPFIAVGDNGHVFITDPEGFRVMEFNEQGELERVWGDFDNTSTGFGLASGIAIDTDGHIWVTDGLYNRIMRFSIPHTVE